MFSKILIVGRDSEGGLSPSCGAVVGRRGEQDILEAKGGESQDRRPVPVIASKVPRLWIPLCAYPGARDSSSVTKVTDPQSEVEKSPWHIGSFSNRAPFKIQPKGSRGVSEDGEGSSQC